MKSIFTVLVLLGSIVLAARADIIVLRNGRMLQVKIGAADEKGISVERLDNGGKLFIRWDLLRDEDKKRLRIRFGLAEEVEQSELTIDGYRIEPKLGDYYDGLIESQTQEEVVLRHEGRLMTFKREAIRRITARPVSVFSVYTPEELYAQKLAEIQPPDDDAAGHFEMGKWAAAIGMYSQAMIHFAKVKEINPEYKAGFIANQLERLDYLEKNKFIRDAIKKAVRSGTLRRFKKAMVLFDQILAEKELDESIRKDVEKLKVKFLKRRWEYYSREVVRGYYREADRRMRALASSRDINNRDEEKRLTLGKAQAIVRGPMHKEIIQTLTDRLNGVKKKKKKPVRSQVESEPIGQVLEMSGQTLNGVVSKITGSPADREGSKYDLTTKDVEKMWKERPPRGTRTASYGSGTFIVAKKKGRRRSNRADQLRRQFEEIRRRFSRGRRGKQNNQPQPPKVKLITKDEWWRQADSSARLFWLRAYYAENTPHMEVVSVRKRNCTTCGGAGTLRQLGPQGGYFNVTCPRCQGHKTDRVVVYR